MLKPKQKFLWSQFKQFKTLKVIENSPGFCPSLFVCIPEKDLMRSLLEYDEKVEGELR